MSNLKYQSSDDELLMVLMNVPNRWVVRNGRETALTTSLGQALRKAHEFSARGGFLGRIVKQPNEEMVVESHQISRLWKHIDLPSD